MKFVSSLLFSMLACLDARAIIIHANVGDAPNVKQFVAHNLTPKDSTGSLPSFPYWEHVGMVGLGSGIYLGEGYVLTSAHVGCHPFRMGDGSTYRPHYASWRILSDSQGCKSDLAIFRVKIDDRASSLANLGRLPIGELEAGSDTPLVMIGTGFAQRPKAVAHEKHNVVLGYEIQRQREKRWGVNYLDKILETPVCTNGGYRTHCFVSTFDRSQGEAQAAEGDSGGAMFAYNTKLGHWEVVGCIIAVSQLGTYVPFGSRTYVGILGSYQKQMPHAPAPEVKIIAQTPAAKDQHGDGETELDEAGDSAKSEGIVAATAAIFED